MSPLIANIDLGVVLGIVVPIGSILIVLMTAILTNHSRRLQRDDMEATLKMEMIERGMTADDIERVLAARMGQSLLQQWHKYGQHPRPQHEHQH